MQKSVASLIGLTFLLLSPLALAATAVPRLEPTGDIIRNGQNLEWSMESNSGYAYAAEQKLFRAWMRETYLAWKGQWQEPLDAERFGVQHRRVRQVLTASHRRAVRTGDWDIRPSLLVGTDRISAVRTVERTYSRPSRRTIINEAEMRNVVRVPATVR